MPEGTGVLAKAAGRMIVASARPWQGRVHITRHQMYSDIREVVASTGLGRGRVLCISGSRTLVEAVGISAADVVEADYPAEDMLDLSFGPEEFDVVVSDQVLEHVEGSPEDAVAEAFRVAKRGGLVIHTTCFLNPIHYGPKDMWRFSPEGLELLCSATGEVVSSGSWGNKLVPVLIAVGARHAPTPPSWHPLGKVARRNNPEWPFVSWVIARKRIE